MRASHVMLEAVVEDTVTLSVDMRTFCAMSFDDMLIPFPTKIWTPFLLQAKRVAIAVQLNSATELSEVLRDLGGIMTTEKRECTTKKHHAVVKSSTVYSSIQCIAVMSSKDIQHHSISYKINADHYHTIIDSQ